MTQLKESKSLVKVASQGELSPLQDGAQPCPAPLSSRTELGSSGQGYVMRPQEGSIIGDLSSGSSMYQLNSKPTGKYKAEQVNCFSKPYETPYIYQLPW